MTGQDKERLREAIQQARSRTFAVVEPLLVSHPSWPIVRSHLLKVFGRDGLEGLLNGTDIYGAENVRRNNQNTY